LNTAASKAARFLRRRRRFAAFPPLRHCSLRTFQDRKPRRCLESGSLLPPQAALRRFATVAALQFADLSDRKPRRCLESGLLLPPQAALRRFSTVAALRLADLSGPQTAPLPRKRLASSAAGGASPLFHRCGIAVFGPFRPANRAAASKAARFFRRGRRFAAFPHRLLKKAELYFARGLM